jgi:geranylgeranyl diphosphate synthase type II
MKSYTASQLLNKINAYLEQMPYSRPPQGLYAPISYELSLGGKRIRPVLMLMAYNLYKEDIDTILPQAAGLETYHNHTLLHDDLMDKADMRRNKQTVHKVWGENAAILSGDAMLILAYRLMADCASDKLKKVLDLFTETTMEICEGQQWDMEFETRMDVTVDEYIEMIRLKTAVLLAAALKMGAIIGGASLQDANALYDYGINLGLAFQLRDDYLDSFGDPAVFGKKIGGDICCNKKTFLMITALQTASEEQRKELLQWIGCTDATCHEQKIKAVLNIYQDLQIDIRCEEAIRAYFEKSVGSLKDVQLSDNKKYILIKFANDLMGRNK